MRLSLKKDYGPLVLLHYRSGVVTTYGFATVYCSGGEGGKIWKT